MKSWSKRELALAVLVVLAAIFVPYAAVPLLARLEQLLSSSATPLILFLYAWISALVTGMPVFSVGPERPAGLALDFGPDYLPGVALPFEQKSGHRRPSGGGLHRFL